MREFDIKIIKIIENNDNLETMLESPKNIDGRQNYYYHISNRKKKRSLILILKLLKGQIMRLLVFSANTESEVCIKIKFLRKKK